MRTSLVSSSSVLAALVLLLAIFAAARADAAAVTTEARLVNDMLELTRTVGGVEQLYHVCRYTPTGGDAVTADTVTKLASFLGFGQATRSSNSYAYPGSKALASIDCPPNAASVDDCVLGAELTGKCPTSTGSVSTVSTTALVVSATLPRVSAATTSGVFTTLGGGLYIRQAAPSKVFQFRAPYSSEWINFVGNVGLIAGQVQNGNGCGGASLAKQFDARATLALCNTIGHDVRFVRTLPSPGANASAPSPASPPTSSSSGNSSSGSTTSVTASRLLYGCTRTNGINTAYATDPAALVTAGCLVSASATTLNSCNFADNSIAVECDATAIDIGGGLEASIGAFSREFNVRKKGATAWGTACVDMTGTTNEADGFCSLMGFRTRGQMGGIGYYNSLTTSLMTSADVPTSEFAGASCPSQATADAVPVTSITQCKPTIESSTACIRRGTSSVSFYVPVLMCASYATAVAPSVATGSSVGSYGDSSSGAAAGAIIGVLMSFFFFVGLCVCIVVLVRRRQQRRLDAMYARDNGALTMMVGQPGLMMMGGAPQPMLVMPMAGSPHMAMGGGGYPGAGYAAAPMMVVMPQAPQIAPFQYQAPPPQPPSAPPRGYAAANFSGPAYGQPLFDPHAPQPAIASYSTPAVAPAPARGRERGPGMGEWEPMEGESTAEDDNPSVGTVRFHAAAN